MEMPALFLFLDPYLIWLFRLSGHGLADFLTGTLILACISLIIGEITSSLASLALKRPISEAVGKAAKYQQLSIEALAEGDKQAYKAANQLANEAFGKMFFLQMGLSAAYLWPIFFFLAWMNYRFAGVEFIPLPLINRSLGYIGVFILLYIPAYISLRSIRKKISGGAAPEGRGAGGQAASPLNSGHLPVR